MERDATNLRVPNKLPLIEQETEQAGFTMASDRLTGSLLRTLAASKRRGRLLELGTGTGLSTCWLLDGMDQAANLKSVDNDPALLEIARQHLDDPRIEFFVQDASEFLRSLVGQAFDLIFADTWAGKYRDLDLALSLLKEGGIYFIDDMLPREDWPEGHAMKATGLIETLANREDLVISQLNWSTGIVLAVKCSRGG
jgi:predicted O-methyltransferase YrrM